MVQKFPLLEVVQACHSLLIPTRTQHVVAVQTVTKAEFRSSQTHEFEAMQKIIPAIQTKGYSIVPVIWI